MRVITTTGMRDIHSTAKQHVVDDRGCLTLLDSAKKFVAAYAPGQWVSVGIA